MTIPTKDDMCIDCGANIELPVIPPQFEKFVGVNPRCEACLKVWWFERNRFVCCPYRQPRWRPPR